MRKDRTQTGLQSTLIRRKKQWSGVAIWQRGKDQNLFLMVQMVRFKIPTAMEMTHVHPRTPGIKHYSSWTQQVSDTTCYFYSILSVSFFVLNALQKRFLNQNFTGEKAINGSWLQTLFCFCQFFFCQIFDGKHSGLQFFVYSFVDGHTIFKSVQNYLV